MKQRLYHLISINERTGQETVLTAYPDAHDHYCTMKAKLTSHYWRRIILREVL